MRIDLHTHTDRSDGRHPPASVLEQAAAGRLDILAITDHDLAAPILPGWHVVGERGLRVIAGTELTAAHHAEEVHILVYFPGQMPPSFLDFLLELGMARVRRYETVRRHFGEQRLPPPDDDALSGRRTLTFTHIARALVEAGVAPSFLDAAALLRSGSPPIIPAPELPALEAIRKGRDAGGFVSWAHPPDEGLARWLGDFRKAGLQALETHRPGLGRQRRNALRQLARRHRLLCSGGSDWHGWNGDPLGLFAVDEDCVAGVLSALGIRVGRDWSATDRRPFPPVSG